jgi:hypothetical protein
MPSLSATTQDFLKPDLTMNKHHATVRINIILIMLIFMVLDISPVPFMPFIGLYVAIFRPRWFINLVDELYNR